MQQVVTVTLAQAVEFNRAFSNGVVTLSLTITFDLAPLPSRRTCAAPSMNLIISLSTVEDVCRTLYEPDDLTSTEEDVCRTLPEPVYLTSNSRGRVPHPP
ncbi:hypothetical protein PoB_005212700 [Plakobranchus ocellatus]|uniref:Uncharacterized protein n=1 Tax=Plakobranchus ocellatus TaxID=259542 RepID=A0AAV4C2Y9_9GAST|nr:hypothetical protein PoB_005212700 [Plakobranchus ocellatus]